MHNYSTRIDISYPEIDLSGIGIDIDNYKSINYGFEFD